MSPSAEAAAQAASAAKHAVCAMAKAQQKAKAKIRWAVTKRKQFLESPYFALEMTPVRSPWIKRVWRLAIELEGFVRRSKGIRDWNDELEKERDEKDERIAELEADLKYEQGKYDLAVAAWFKKVDVSGLLLMNSKLRRRNKKLEEETESLKTTVEQLNQKLAQKRVNNPYGCKGKPKQKPPVSPRRNPTKREERTPRKTPSKKKGGWGAPLAGASMGGPPAMAVATTTRASVQFGAEGMRELVLEPTVRE